jgi:hypothetical protein
MNWNSFDLYTHVPATIETSGQIARTGQAARHLAPRPGSSLPGQPLPDAHAGSGGCVRKIL